MNQIVNSLLNKYLPHDIETDTTSYYGFLAPDGSWIIQKTTATAIRYATGGQQIAGYTSYSAAWTGRAGLTYGYITEVSL